MKLIGKNIEKKIHIYFDCVNQVYNVYKNGKFLIGNKYKYSDVKGYLD